jgi:hypothetical protein
MNFGLIISSIALGISLMVSAIKLVDWLIRADPRAVMHMGRWLLFLLAIASVPSLILLLIYHQLALAMTLGAGMPAAARPSRSRRHKLSRRQDQQCQGDLASRGRQQTARVDAQWRPHNAEASCGQGRMKSGASRTGGGSTTPG